MRDIRILVFLSLICCSCFSQKDSLLIHAPQHILLRLGKNALLQDDPNSAVTILETYHKSNKKNAKANYYLAQAYWQIRDYDKAQRMFLNAYKLKKQDVPEALYYHAEALKTNGKYDSAKYSFDKFSHEYHGSNKSLKRQAKKEALYCDSISKFLYSGDKVKITHLDTSINKVNTEAAPVSLNENTMIFSSLRTNAKEYVHEDEPEISAKKKIYSASRNSNEWKYSGEFDESINDKNYNIGNIALSPDKKRMYYAKCKPNEQGMMICALYVSEKKGDHWSEGRKLPKTINKRRSSNTMPTVVSDPVKGTDVLYFVSNRKHGKGGLDIWYSVYDKKLKEWKLAKNAGSHINTSQNEISPFFDNENRTMYLSSDGWPGLGGYDIFEAIGDGKKWSTVINMAQPYNSGADDFYFSIGAKHDEGFFVSNRKGGYALKHATCCDDIYAYKVKEYIFVKLIGQVGEVIDYDSPVKNATIEIYSKDKITGEKYLKKKITTDSFGKYETQLEADEEYFTVVKQKDFLGQSEEISTKGMKTGQVIEKKFGMIKKPKDPITIPNINYAFDKSDLYEDSKKILDSILVQLMNNNPELIIEIQSHTDSKGSDASNIRLSQKRAESVVKHLVSRGISSKRLKAKGYGESKPVAPNQNPDGSDNEHGRAQNRRTDFKIIGNLDAEIIYESALDK